jgi:hypothetical protein
VRPGADDASKQNPVAGWTNQPGNTNQIWDFEQYSFTPDELDGHIKTMPLKPGASIVSFTSPQERRYLDRAGGAVPEDRGRRQHRGVPSRRVRLYVFFSLLETHRAPFPLTFWRD